LDSDVAVLYGVVTRDINKAVKNNPEKFPEQYIIQLNKNEKNELVENFHRFDALKHSTTCSDNAISFGYGMVGPDGLRDRSVFIGHDIYSRDELMPNRLQSLFFF